jgi:hypothetical protein
MFYLIRTRLCPEDEKKKTIWTLGFRFGPYECLYNCPSMGTIETAQQLKEAFIAAGLENDVIIFEARYKGFRGHTWVDAEEERIAWGDLNASGNDIVVKADTCYEEWYWKSVDAG